MTALRRDAQSNLERVLTAAAEVFATQGLSATLADVAKHAGVGVGTVYRRFANKDDLIYEVYAGPVRAGEELVRAASTAPDVWDGFVRFFELSIQMLANDRGLRELTTGGVTASLGWSRGTPPDRLAALVGENHQTMGRYLTKLVRRAKKAGVLRADFHATDMMLLSLGVQATMALGGAQRPDLYRRSLGYILDGLRPARPDVTKLPAPPLSETDLRHIRQR